MAGFGFVLQGATKDGEEDTLELRFEYNDSGTWQWIILYTKQVSSQSFWERISLKGIFNHKESSEVADPSLPESSSDAFKQVSLATELCGGKHLSS